MTLRSRLAAAAAGLAFAAPPAAALANTALHTLAVGGSSFTSAQGVDTIGWAFTANDNLSVTGFGWFVLAPQLNGFHQVGIWDAAGTLLGSSTVLPGSASADGFRYVATAFTPFTLGKGKSYVIGGVDVEGDGDRYLTALPSVTTDPAIAFLGAARGPVNTTGLVFPSVVNNGVNGRIGPNFQFAVLPAPIDDGAVPEPAAWALMIVGFGLAGAGLRGRKAAARPA